VYICLFGHGLYMWLNVGLEGSEFSFLCPFVLGCKVQGEGMREGMQSAERGDVRGDAQCKE
jgi:hypothetical protein